MPHTNPLTGSTINAPPRASKNAIGQAVPTHDDPPALPGRKKSAIQAADRWSGHRNGNENTWRRESWSMCSELSASIAPAPALGRVIASLQDVRVRDAMIVNWFGGTPAAIADTLRGVDSAQVTAVLDHAMRGRDAKAPTTDETVSRLEWCTTLIAHARNRDKAPMLTLAAVALWWSGDLNIARATARQALGYVPHYSLATLIHDICEANIGPAWQKKARGV